MSLRWLLLSLALLGNAEAAETWPDIDAPLRTGASAPNDAAVVIGNEDYIDVPNVPYAGADADAFRSFLIYTRGVDPSQVQSLHNASPAQMEEAVKRAAAEVGAGGTLWVYYAGHGAAHPVSKERVLLGRAASLDPNPTIFEEGTVSVEALKAAASGQGEVVFVVDACYSGTGRSGDQLGGGRFAVVPTYSADARATEWTATQPDQVASPLDAAGHGAFTYFAVGALRGWADGELDGRRDGEVSLKEAQTYVERALKTVGLRDQTPAVVGQQAAALVDSRGLESAPDLRSLSAGGASVVQATSGELVSSGGFVADLDVSAALAEKACADAAEREASSQRSLRVSSEAQSLAREAQSAWSKLGPSAEACLGLDLTDRGQCISKVKEYIGWAGSLEVALTEGFEKVSTDCGERSVAMSAQRKPVSVPELAAAKAVLVRLESASGTSEKPTNSTAQSSDASVEKYDYEMVEVSGGDFHMGTEDLSSKKKVNIRMGPRAPSVPLDEAWHQVNISGFWMGKTEVTQGLYQQVMGTNPSKFSSCGASCPVEQVSWVDAVTFANKLSALEGLEACYSISGTNVSWPKGRACTGYRLPTEAEWEYAARAGQSTTYSGSNEPGGVAWYKDNSSSKTHPVAQKQSNAWGLYDMSGNVWEWSWDWYSSSYYQSSSSTDPAGPDMGSQRVMRGGGWSNYAYATWVVGRGYSDPSSRGDSLGFRLSRSIQTGSLP